MDIDKQTVVIDNVIMKWFREVVIWKLDLVDNKKSLM